MLNFAAKSLLAASSLAPMLVVYALAYIGADWRLSAGLIAGAVCLGILCKLILVAVQHHAPKRTIQVKSAKISDQAMFTFVVVYLFPLVFAKSSDDPSAIRYSVLAFVFVLLLVAIYRSNAYFFNPTMGLLFGYHFYEITTDQDFTYLLVSKRKIVNTKNPVQGKELSPYMFLEAER